jgi:hypothetical protein
MDKFLLQQQVLERLAEDLLQAEQAARADINGMSRTLMSCLGH